HVASDRLAFLAILEVTTAPALELRSGGGPDGRGRALRGRLETRAWLPVGIEPAERVHVLAAEMLLQAGHDATRMDGVGGDAGSRPTPRELHGEESVRGLRLSVGQPPVIGAALEVDVVEVHRREPVADRAERDDPAWRAGLERRREPSRRRSPTRRRSQWRSSRGDRCSRRPPSPSTHVQTGTLRAPPLLPPAACDRRSVPTRMT